MEELVTSKDILKIIQESESMAYDHNHEWSPSYTLTDKADFLENMLKKWDITDPEGKDLIIQFMRTLIFNSGVNSDIVTDKLVYYFDLIEVETVLNESIVSGIFAINLLISMKRKNKFNEGIFSKIQDYSNNKKFNESTRQIKRHDLYNKIQKMILEFTINHSRTEL